MSLSNRLAPLALAIAAAAGSVQSETFTLEEIVVTAQKRAESLQDVPISVSAMSGEKLAEAGIPAMSDFSAYVPNFNVTSNAIGDVISIRGIQSGILASVEQSVGTFTDGIYRGRGTQSRFSFLDVGTIEVLRGPQSTLFGKNTIGGALNITSAKPTEDFEAEISGMYEVEHEETEIKGYVSGALSDTVRGRFAFQTREMDEGWIENTYYDENEPQTDEYAGRLSLEWDASDDLLISFKYEHGEWDNNGMPYEQQIGSLGVAYATVAALEGGVGVDNLIGADVTPKDGKSTMGNSTDGIDYGASQTFEGDSDEFAFRADYSMDSGTLTAIAGYSEYQFERNLDADFNAFDGIGFEEYEDYDQTSLEVRFVSELGEGFEFITGMYYQESNLTANAKSNFNVDASNPESFAGPAALAVIGEHNIVHAATGGAAGVHPGFVGSAMTPADFGAAKGFVGTIGQFTRAAQLDQETESWAAFAQGTWDLNDTLRLTAGVRYGEEEKEASQSALCAEWDSYNTGTAFCNPLGLVLAEFTPHEFDDLSRDEEDWTYTVNLQWDVTSDIMAYATVSTGTKSGGFNNFALSANPDEAEFDQEKVKSMEIGAKMSLLDGAAELNFAVFDMDYDDLQASIFTGATGFKVENAATATVRGFEADGRWQVAESLMLRGSVGYVDFEFDEYDVAGCTNAQKDALTAVSTAVGGLPWGTFIKPAPGTTAAGATAVDLDGNGSTDSCAQNLAGGTNAFTPEWTGSLSLEHEINIGDNLYLRTVLDANYLDDHHTAADNDELVYQDSYVLTNLTVTLGSQDDRWDVSFVGRNITDEEYITYSNDMPLFAGNQQVAWGREASYAVRGRLKF
ncbi:MAG: TonB-dependent receptor [Cellvibrionaceae bacterium]